MTNKINIMLLNNNIMLNKIHIHSEIIGNTRVCVF